MTRILLSDAVNRVPAFLEELQEVVCLESPSHDQGAVAASAAALQIIGARHLGARADTINVDGCTHLRWKFGHGASRVIVLAHHDTVWPIGTIGRIPWEVRHGMVTGPGCFDMKFGIVQAFHALAMLGADRRDGITLLVTGDEEIGSPSSRALIESEAAGCSAALVLEAAGPGGALKVERKGVSLYEVGIEGRAAHAGLEPERGINAGIELAHQVLALAALSDAQKGTSVTPTMLLAGTTTNTVPASARISVDVRVRDALEQRRVDSAIRSLTPVTPGSTISIDGGANRPPLEQALTESLYALAVSVAARQGLSPLESVSVGGASDGNFTAGLGVPTLDGLGAVGGGAHADDEHVHVDCIAERVALLAGLLEALQENQDTRKVSDCDAATS